MEQDFNQPLSALERALAIELAVDVAVWADKGGYDRPDGAMFDGYGHHFHQGPFDSACATLWRLGVAVATDGDPTQIDLPYPVGDDLNRHLPAYFKFFQESEIRSILSQNPIASRQWFCWLIDDWLSFAFDYQGLPQTRSVFEAEGQFHHSLHAFVRCRLALESGGKFKWTQTMAPHMRNSGYWNDDGSSTEDRFEEDFTAFVRSLPDHWRQEMIVLARKPGSRLIFADRFRRDFAEFGWSQRFSSDPGPIGLGLKLFDAFGGQR
jgi:hypothetical protein